MRWPTDALVGALGPFANRHDEIPLTGSFTPTPSAEQEPEDSDGEQGIYEAEHGSEL